MNTGRGNAIAANVVGEIIASNGIRHRNHGSLAHGVGKAVGQAGRSRDGRDVQDHSTGVLHVANDGVHAVVEAFDVDAKNTVEVFGCRALDRADVRDSGIVHEDGNAIAATDVCKCCIDLRGIGDVARVGGGGAATCCDLGAGLGCGGLTYIQNANSSAVGRKFQCDGATDAAAAAGDRGNFAVQSKSRRLDGSIGQSDTPLFQGIKSSCAFCSAFVRTAPLAT